MHSAEIQIVILGEFDPVIKQTMFMLEPHGNRSLVVWKKAYLYKQEPSVNGACAHLSTGSTAPC